MGTNKHKEALWPAVPSRIVVEDSPLLAQVFELMEHAKPMQTLRHSSLRDRAIAGVARRETAQRERERTISRKRGRRSGTAHSALEQAYLPSGLSGESMGAGDGISRRPPRGGWKRRGPAWNGSANIDRSEIRSRRSDGGNFSCSSGDEKKEVRLRRGLPGSKSEQTISLQQSSGSDTSFTSRGGVTFNLGDNELLSSSWITPKSQVKRRHRHRRDNRLPPPNRSSRPKAAVATACTTMKTLGSRVGGSYCSDASPSASVSFASSSSSPGSKSPTPLPGVCYITYPPTPDLTAMAVPASSDGSVGHGLNDSDGSGGAGKGVSPITRKHAGDPSMEFSDRQQGKGCAAPDTALTGSSPPAHLLFREARGSSCDSTEGDDGEDWERVEEPPLVDGSHGRASTSTRDASPTSPSLTRGAELEACNSQRLQQEQRRQPKPGADDQSGGKMFQHRESVSMGGEGAEVGRSGREGHGSRRTRKSRGRHTPNPCKARSRVRSKTAPTDHPLGTSRISPTLPGVDEHQRPVFWLAEMHENLRKNRTRMDTEIETELSMVVRYFMRFGAKGGRDGLTLQDLEAAFRASRRADAFVAIEKKGKAAFAKCLSMLEAHGLTPEAWLEELLSKRKGDSLTTFDMGESIRAYNRAKPSWVRSHKHWLREFMIPEKDLRWCQRFVDPDGNTDVDAEEFSNAVRSTLDGKPRISFEESRAVELILEFERFMAINRIRLVDLFEKVDKDKGGTIDEDELREFLKLGRKKTETGMYGLLVSLKSFTRTTGLRLVDMIQATGAHPEEGMDPSQLQSFFERATNCSLRLTKESLEKIVTNVDEDGDGLLSLSEIQLVLTQHTQDELLLRRLAKAVAQHVSRQDKADHANKKGHDPPRQS
ncbi:unnamed protein product, partial [Scytosiphon promiscuus]